MVRKHDKINREKMIPLNHWGVEGEHLYMSSDYLSIYNY